MLFRSMELLTIIIGRAEKREKRSGAIAETAMRVSNNMNSNHECEYMN